MEHTKLISSPIQILPNQAMASIDELKSELAKSIGNPLLQISILSSLVSKLEPEDGILYLKQKILLMIEANSLQEAEIDTKALIDISNTQENKLIYCKVLIRKKDYLNSMTQLLKLKNVSTSEIFYENSEYLLESSYFDSLYVIPNLPDLYSSEITFFPELRGKIVMQICSSSCSTYILISTCWHLPNKTACPLGLSNCTEGLQLLEISNNRLSPVESVNNQKVSMVSCSDNITGVLNTSGKITLWGELPESRSFLTLENPCKEIAVGSSYVLMIKEDKIDLWGQLGTINTIAQDYMSYHSFGVRVDNNDTLGISGSVSCSSNHVLLLNNGEVFTIGIGEEGQLGLGDINSVDFFEKTEINSHVIQVLCNNEVSVGLTREFIYVWGLINPLQVNGAPRNV